MGLLYLYEMLHVLIVKVYHQGGNMQHFVKARIVCVIKDGHVDRNCHYYLVYQTQ